MKQVLKLYAFCVMLTMLFFFSCQKEYPCFDCNKEPVASAGVDQKITIPVDSVFLDGSGSKDADGNIVVWSWTEVSGPATSTIVSGTSTKTQVRNLVKGTYLFELEVTDNLGASARDTVQVTVEDLLANQPAVNQTPVANAGSDQIITLPTSTVTVSGVNSTDPDNNITTYKWTSISGPPGVNISNANAVATQVSGLTQGVYEFELKVTDAGGLFANDTVRVTVNAITMVSCGDANRPTVNARLTPLGRLSELSSGMAVASVGNKIFFAGASVSGNPPKYGSSKVHIFDIATQSWSTAALSASRADVAVIAAGNKVFFAGGKLGNGGGNNYFSTVDIYDLSTNQWSVADLSQSRANAATATVGDKVFFAGGEQQWPLPVSDRIDIYDLGTNTWSTASLSVQRNGLTAVTANNKICFAGGSNHLGGTNNVLSIIDVYDNASNSWSTTTLSEPKAFFAGIHVGSKIYWAGGDDASGAPSCKVEIKDLSNQTSSSSFLFHPSSYSIQNGQNTVVKDNKIIWFTTLDPFNGNSMDKFNIYDLTTGTWSIGLLPFKISGSSIISVNNTIYVAGGSVNGNMTDLVWKLEL